MTRPRMLPIYAGILAIGLPAMAAENRTVSYQTLEGDHPTGHRQVLTVPEDTEGDVYACFGYAHDGKKKGDVGSNRGKVTITRTDPDTGEESTEILNKRGNLDKNKWLRCVHTGPMLAGDTAVFEYEFEGYPKPRGNTIHIVSSIGADRLKIGELRGREATGDPGDPTQLHQRESSIVARNGKHPKAWQQAIVVQNDSLDKVNFCFGYGNTTNKGNKGKGKFRAEIPRTDPDTGEEIIQVVKKTKKLKDHRIKYCEEIDPLNEGDVIVVDVDLTGFPKLRGNDGEEEAVVAGGQALEVITGIGPTEMVDSEILAPRDFGGGDGGPGDGGGDGLPPTAGDLSAADQSAVLRLLSTAHRTAQLWRPKGNGLGKWTAIGPRFLPGNVFNVDPATVGAGSTIAEAVADYEKKRGKLKTVSGGLSKAEQTCFAWMGTINPSGGSTAVRWGPDTNWHADLYRPSLGVVVVKQKSRLASCEFLRKTLEGA